MLIGELVNKSGFTRDAIRFYEKSGLIRQQGFKRLRNNYKVYSEQVLERLILIGRIKSLGFTLQEIKTFFRLWEDDGASCRKVNFVLKDKLAEIDQEIARLTALKGELNQTLQCCGNDECEFEGRLRRVGGAGL